MNQKRTFKVVVAGVSGLSLLVILGWLLPPVEIKTKAEPIRIKTSVNRVDHSSP